MTEVEHEGWRYRGWSDGLLLIIPPETVAATQERICTMRFINGQSMSGITWDGPSIADGSVVFDVRKNEAAQRFNVERELTEWTFHSIPVPFMNPEYRCETCEGKGFPPHGHGLLGGGCIGCLGAGQLHEPAEPMQPPLNPASPEIRTNGQRLGTVEEVNWPTMAAAINANERDLIAEDVSVEMIGNADGTATVRTTRREQRADVGTVLPQLGPGFLSLNEYRHRQGLPPIEGGDNTAADRGETARRIESFELGDISLVTHPTDPNAIIREFTPEEVAAAEARVEAIWAVELARIVQDVGQVVVADYQSQHPGRPPNAGAVLAWVRGVRVPEVEGAAGRSINLEPEGNDDDCDEPGLGQGRSSRRR